MRYKLLLLFIGSTFILSACLDEPQEKQTDYEQTKKMVVDILQTDEGKRALADLMQDDKMREHIIFESSEMKDTIIEGLATEEAKESWKQLFDDPAFVKKFIETMNDEQKELFKDLMTDATFQKQMLELLQNKEMMDFLLTIMRSQTYREYLEETIMETLQSPLFEAQMQKFLLDKSVKIQEKSDQEKSDEKSDENS